MRRALVNIPARSLILIHSCVDINIIIIIANFSRSDSVRGTYDTYDGLIDSIWNSWDLCIMLGMQRSRPSQRPHRSCFILIVGLSTARMSHEI